MPGCIKEEKKDPALYTYSACTPKRLNNSGLWFCLTGEIFYVILLIDT